MTRLCQPFSRRICSKTWAEDAVADPEEMGVGDVGEEFAGDGEEVVVAFEWLKAGDGAVDECRWGGCSGGRGLPRE